MRKLCSKCGVNKTYSEFGKSKLTKIGLYSSCKLCRKKDKIKFNQENPNYDKEYARKWREANKQKLKDYYISNRERTRKWARERWRNNPNVRRTAKNCAIKKTYGISLEDYDKLLEKQAGVCVICGQLPKSNRKSNKLAIDHSHRTGKVRGLLCHRCNNGLGCYDDSIELLQKAVEYLKEREYNTIVTTKDKKEKGEED